MASSSIVLHRIALVICVFLLLTSLVTLGLAGHAKWLLERHFPGGAWYIWKGNDGDQNQEQIRQQWVAVDYSEVTERLAVVRAVLGVAAGAMGVWSLWSRGIGMCGQVCREIYCHILIHVSRGPEGNDADAIISYRKRTIGQNSHLSYPYPPVLFRYFRSLAHLPQLYGPTSYITTSQKIVGLPSTRPPIAHDSLVRVNLPHVRCCQPLRAPIRSREKRLA